MLSPAESRASLSLVTGNAVEDAVALLGQVTGRPSARRSALLEGVPSLISYYSDGSSALAADFYDDQREIAAPPKLYLAEPIIPDRVEKIRRGVAWASDPLFEGDLDLAASRLEEIVQDETARPFRQTIITNRQRDPSAVGWRRIASGSGCKMCRMLADRGVVYTQETARFAAHTHCNCTAQPVFSNTDYGEEANVMQYMASSSRRKRTPKQRQQLREYLNDNY